MFKGIVAQLGKLIGAFSETLVFREIIWFSRGAFFQGWFVCPSGVEEKSKRYGR